MEQNVSCLNIPKSKIAYLKSLGYNYVCDLEPSVLTEKLNLQNLSTLQKCPETKTALDLYQDELVNGSILSYNEKLDCILENIVVPKTITEFAGLSGSGKTQVCFQLCISVQLPKLYGGVGGEAIYISTNGNFASHRIREMSTNFIEQYNSLKVKMKLPHGEFNEDFILKHIHYIRINDGLQLIACIEYMESYMLEKNIRLIVIDSISYPLRFFNINERKTTTTKLFRDLRNLAHIYNLSVVLTNDLTTRANEGEFYVTPSFGDSFFHLVNNRILFSKVNDIFHDIWLSKRNQGQNVLETLQKCINYIIYTDVFLFLL